MAGKWTRERVIEAIQARAGQKSRVVTTRHDYSLYDAGRRLFGGWHDALRAAGVEPCQQKWSRQAIVDAILARHRSGWTLRGITSRDQALYTAACRHFGDWPKALAAAGLPSPPKRCWSKQLVIEAIQARSRQGLPMRGINRDDRPLLYAAQKFWGCWDVALLAAGIRDVPPRRWNRRRLIAALEAVRQQGIPLTSRRVPYIVYEAACRHFGGWHEALEAVGFEAGCRRPQQWTSAVVLEQIQALHRQGASLRAHANKALSRAAARRFGNWRAALRAAGVPTAEPLRRWSRQAVLDELQVLAQQGRFDESTWIEDRKLVAAAKWVFGTWRGALIAAGVLAPEEKRRRRGQWTRQRVIEAIQDHYVRGLPMVADHVKGLSTAARREFGSWEDALAAAGIEVQRKRRPRRQWSRQSVIDEIRAMRERGARLVNVGPIHGGLAAAARRYFGSWHAALVAAGAISADVEPPCRQRWSKQRILHEIRLLHRQGASLNSESPEIRLLVAAACRHFGGWRLALLAAKIPGAPKPHQKWSTLRVMDALKSLVRNGEPISAKKCSKALACAAYRYFGSWHEALAAAGFLHAEDDR